MRYRIETQEYPDSHTVDGVTAQVTRTRRVAVPVLPRDVDALAVRAVVGLVLGLTLVSVAWSTVSIAYLLRGSWVAYLAGAVFDLAWLAVLGMAYLVRYRPDRRRVVDRVGWVLLAATVAAIGVEGYRTGGLAVACIGASVSVAAKALWWTFGRATRPELAAADAQWVAAQLSQASARMAVAAVRRQAARVEDQAAARPLAMEASRRPPAGTVVPVVPSGSELEVPSAGTGSEPEVPSAGTGSEPEVPSAGTTDGKTGLYVPPGDVQVAASASASRNFPSVPSQVRAGSRLVPRNPEPVSGTSTAMIRELVARGVRDVNKIGELLSEAGFRVPSGSYVRRLVRERRTDTGTGPYL